METSFWFGLIVIMLMQLLTFVQLQRQREELRELQRKVVHIDATRQSRIKGTTSVRRAPTVDAEAKVQHRYPRESRGARMGQAVERKPSHGRESTDD